MSIFSRAKRTFKSAVSKVKSGASKIASVAKNSFAAVVNPIKNSAGVSTLPKSQPNYKGLNNVEKDAYTPTDYSKDILATGLKSGGLKVISTGSTGGLYQPSRRSSQSNGTSLSSSSLSSPGLNSYGGASQIPSTKTIGAGGRSSGGLSSFSGGSNPSFTFGGDSEGNSPTLSSDAISAASNVSLPSAPAYANVSAVNNAGLASALGETQTYDQASGLIVPQPVTPIDETQPNTLDDKIAKALELNPIPEKDSVYDDRQVKKQQAEVRARQQEVNNYTAQLNNIVAKQNADLLNLRGIGAAEGVTETVYGGQAATINREAAIKALPIQAQVAAAQGNLELAQDYLTELLTIKKDQIDADYAYNVAKFNVVREIMTAEEKRELDKIEKDDNRAYERAQDNLNLVNDWIKYALENGAGREAGQLGKLADSIGLPDFQAKLGQIVAGIQDKDAGGGSDSVSSRVSQVLDGFIGFDDLTTSEAADVRDELYNMGFGSKTAPEWFREYIETELRMSLTPARLKEEWDSYQNGIMSKASSGGGDEIDFDSL